MAELAVSAIGLLLLFVALTRAGASNVTWWLFRQRIARLLIAVLALFIIAAAFVHWLLPSAEPR